MPVKTNVEKEAPPFKFGKKPASHDPRDLQLAQFERMGAKLTIAPVGFGPYTRLPVKGWGMLGNDKYGDCEWAESAHSVMALSSLKGAPVKFTDEGVLSDYAACTGFDPNDPNTDQGTDMHQSMAYKRKTGIIDASNKRHKIGAYLSLEPGNWSQLLEAFHVYEDISIGIAFPDYAMDQFNRGKPWSVVSGAPEPTEGHAINVVGRPKSRSLYIVTWGQLQEMTNAFYAKYCDEAYVYVSQEDLVAGKSPTGYDLSELNSILAQF